MSKTGLAEQRTARLNKINEFNKLGINPYPSKCLRTHYSKDIIDNFEKYEEVEVTIAGRLMSIRKHGSLTFAHLQDQTGRIQLAIGKNVLEASESNLSYANLKLLDIGDFIEAKGKVIKTKKGEISILSEKIRLLTKSLRPLPDKWKGLKDREQILRKRYLDTTVQPEKKDVFFSISKMLFAIRTFLNEKGFVEFLTPVLQPQYGGGTAKPFMTHLNALNCDMYLSISHELYLKRLIAAGYDKVFTIGRYFRNEGVDRSHHPEFSMIETMTAYQNYEYNMDLVEDMFRFIAKEVYGKTEFKVQGHMIDFDKPWKRISMSDSVLEVTGIDFNKCLSVEEANKHLSSLGIEEEQTSIGMALAKAFEEKVESTLINPTLIFGHPIDISPLAKPFDSDKTKAERFEIFIAGMECGDNWSEQNDPVELLKRWKENYKPEDRDEEEFHPLDFDFIEVLEYGIPPTTGIGPGIERMAMIFNEQDNIDDVIFFPIMKPHLSKANKDIFEVSKADTLVNKKELLITIDEVEDFIENNIQSKSSAISIKPYLKFWKQNKAEDKVSFRASGYIEINGFINNRLLKIAGYTVKSEKELIEKDELKKFEKVIKSSVVNIFSNLHFKNELLNVEVIL